MSISEIPNDAKFCGDPTRSVRHIRDQKFVLPEKVDQNSPKSLKTCYPLKPPCIMPNFIEIGETILEKSITKFLHPSIFQAPEGDPLGQRLPV